VAKKLAKGPIFEGNMPPKKMYPQKWRQYWRHNRNPVNCKPYLKPIILNNYVIPTYVLLLLLQNDGISLSAGEAEELL
jgi:hypothetical protein